MTMSVAVPDLLQRNITRDQARAFLAGDMAVEDLPDPQWGPIGKEVYERTYSRTITTPDGDRNETWAETVRRVVTGNIGFAPDSANLDDEPAELFELIYNLKATPAGRHLWVTGTTNAFSRNCFISGFSAKLSDHFKFLASRLFEGGGVGANYSMDLIRGSQAIISPRIVKITCREDHPDIDAIKAAAGDRFVPLAELTEHPSSLHLVDDSREGWVATWVKMIDDATSMRDQSLSMVIDVSDVRPYGAALKTFGGKASGPAPLVTACLNIRKVLNAATGRYLSGVEAMEIDHEIAASVVAGGTRRSARMSMMHWNDPFIFDFLACKKDHTKHWSTNISVEIDNAFRAATNSGDAHALTVLDAVAEGMVLNGEPGFIDTDQHSIGEKVRIRSTNPCGEASLSFDPADSAGESCNLGSVNLAAFGTDIEGAKRAFYLMARFLYRATLNPYPDEAASRIEKTNRRIGVGIMGLQGWLAAHGVKLTELADNSEMKEHLTGFRQVCRDSADEIASDLGLPRSIKVTAVAPTGTIAQLSGTTPGIHPVFARTYLRRVRYADTDPNLTELASKGYRIVDDVYAANTKVVEFPQKDSLAVKYGAKLVEQSDEVSFYQFMDMVAAVQETFCGGTDGQAVSATAQISHGTDPKSMAFDIVQFLGRVKGVTAFPDQSGRALAPYEAITEQEFDDYASELFYADLASLTGDSNDGECVGGACPIR